MSGAIEFAIATLPWVKIAGSRISTGHYPEGHTDHYIPRERIAAIEVCETYDDAHPAGWPPHLAAIVTISGVAVRELAGIGLNADQWRQLRDQLGL